MGTRLSKLAPWVVVGLLLLTFALRTPALEVQELSFDEVGSVYIADRGPLGMLTYLRGAIREHPPFYYLLLSLWMPLAGRSEFAVRFLSVAIGTMTVAAIYRLTSRDGRRSVALLAMLLLLLSPFHLRISRSARMYALLALWSLLSLFIFIQLLRQDAHKEHRWIGYWIFFWIVTGLGMFTHYFMAFVLIAEDVFLLLNWRRYRHLWVRWLIIHAILGGIVVLWAIISPGLGATLLSLWRRGMASRVRWDHLARALNGLYLGATLRPNWYHLGLPLLLTGLGVGLALRQNRGALGWERSEGLLLPLLLSVPLIAILAMPERVVGRYLTTALPASILAMTQAIGQLKKPSFRGESRLWGSLPLYLLGWTSLIGIAFVNFRAYPPAYSPVEESLRDRMAYLKTHARADDGLLLHGPWQSLLLTYYDAGPPKPYNIPMKGLQVEADLTAKKLSEIFNAHERVWVSYNSVEPVDPDWIVSHWLHEHTHQVWSKDKLNLYYSPPVEELPAALSRPLPDEDAAVKPSRFQILLPMVMRAGASGYDALRRTDVIFGDKLQLAGWALANPDPTAGEALLLLTRWRATEDISHGLTLWLDLIDATGNTWAEYQFRVGPAHAPIKRWEAGEAFIERRGVLVPVGVPPGEYELRVRAFPAVGGGEWLPTEEPFTIGPIRVERSVSNQGPNGTAPLDCAQYPELCTASVERLHITFGDTLALVGYIPWGERFTQGNPLLFNIYWQALITPKEDYELGMALIDDHGEVLTEQRVQPVTDWFPTSQWRAGDLVKARHAFQLPLDTPPGHYHIRLAVYAPDGAPLPVAGTYSYKVLDWWTREKNPTGSEVLLRPAVKIEERPRRYRAPNMEHRLDVVLGPEGDPDDVRLLGYDITTTSVEPGGAIELTFYWKALRQMDRIYAVFNHLVGPDETLLSQEDSWPQGGAYHTNQWLPGEVIEDHHTIQIPPDASPGEYELRVGMYNAANGERPVTLVDDTPIPQRYVVLTTVRIENRESRIEN